MINASPVSCAHTRIQKPCQLKVHNKRCSHDAQLIESTKKRGNEELNPAVVESTAAGLHPQALMQKTAAPLEPGGRAVAGEINLEPMKRSTSVMDRL
jgi:hypothetical protein